MKKLAIIICGVLLMGCKKEQILYDTERKYMLDGISDPNIVLPIKLLKNVSGPLLPGKKEKYRTGTWQCIDQRKVDTMYINEMNLKYY